MNTNPSRSKSTSAAKPKLVILYQPHQNLRQHEPAIRNGYLDCFFGADIVYWLPTYLSRENQLSILQPAELIKPILEYQSDLTVDDKTQFETVNFSQSLIHKLKNHLNQEDLVLVLGAGNVDNWVRENCLES